MQQLAPPEDGTSSQSLALQKFAALTLQEQLPILMFVLREDLGARERRGRRQSGVRPTPAGSRPPAPVVAPAVVAPAVVATAMPAPAPLGVAPPAAAAASMRVIEDLAQQLDATLPQAPRRRAARSAGAARDERSQTRMTSILFTMLVSFVLAFILMSRQPRAQLGERPRPEPHMPEPVAPRVEYAPPPAPASASAPPPAPQTPAAARSLAGEAMPVTVHFRRRGLHADPNDRSKINWYMQGRVTNQSDTPMNIEVRVESTGALSASQIQIDVAAHTEKEFGVDEGLEMHPGDRVTLLSAPYPDLIVSGVH